WEAGRGLAAAARTHAMAALAALEAASGPDPAAKGAVGEVLLGAGDPVGAERVVREALALRPGDEDLAFGLADALADQGKRADALAALPLRDGAGEYLLARLASWHAVHPDPPAPGEHAGDLGVDLALAARARLSAGSHPAKLTRFDGIVAGAYLAAHRDAEASRAFAEALGRDALQPPDRHPGAAAAAARR